MSKYYVYALIDPRTNQPFYIGKGCNDRMYKHEQRTRNGHLPNGTNGKLYKYIKELLSNGLSTSEYKTRISQITKERMNRPEIKEKSRLGWRIMTYGQLARWFEFT